MAINVSHFTDFLILMVLKNDPPIHKWTPTPVTGGNYSAGMGLVFSGTEFSMVTSSVQTRVSGVCAVGNTIRAINADCTVVCEAHDARPNATNVNR